MANVSSSWYHYDIKYVWSEFSSLYLCYLTNAEDGIDWGMFGILFAKSSSIRFANELLLPLVTSRNLLCGTLLFDMITQHAVLIFNGE